MVFSNLANVCSHLSNASKARLAITSIPNTKMHRKLSHALRDSGFVSSVVIGGKTPPPPHKLLGHASVNDEEEPVEPITQSNVASRRIWLSLKYWQSGPVLQKMIPISKPKQKLNLDVTNLRSVILGQRRKHIDGLRSPGECLFLSTDQGLMESRECVEKKVGGLVLCRVL